MTFEYMLKERERIGIEQGRAEGHTAGLSEGHAAGLSEGRSEGLAEGEAIGLEKGRSEGEAIGLEKGLVEGAAQEKREIAKSMIKEGIAKEIIKKVTGLSADEIEKL